MLEKITLIDSNSSLCEAWRNAFSDYPEVDVLAGDYFQRDADAIVSPANSFGFMDGGLDLAIKEELGHKVEEDIQKVIVDKYHGEMPVGCAEIIETTNNRWKHMIAAPTMRVPEHIGFTLNPYIAFRAILIAINTHNKDDTKTPIKTLICCGLGTGVGSVTPTRCAGHMRAAYKMINEPAKISSYNQTHKIHNVLTTI